VSSAGRASWAGTLSAAAAASLALHAGGLAAASRLSPRPPGKEAPVEVAFEAVEPAPPPPPPPRAELPPPAPPAPHRVSMARLPPAPKEPARPAPPPPPNEPTPPAAPPAKTAVPLTGLSLSSTVEAGGFAVPIGNTSYGKAPEIAPDPREVRPYAAEGSSPPAPAPPRSLSAQPRLVEQPEVPYPAEARRAGVEGQVKLLLRIDRQGRVISARILAEPGGGLGEAARSGALRFRFSPGVLDGEPVEVPDFLYTYTFVLE